MPAYNKRSTWAHPGGNVIRGRFGGLSVMRIAAIRKVAICGSSVYAREAEE